MNESILLQVEDGVATLTLNRPEKRNAVTYDMWRTLTDICTALSSDATVRLLVVRGAGDHFCAGADIEELAKVDPGDYRSTNDAADYALASFPKPTIAAITGSCIGGGTEIAVACDLRIADTTARFGITPARLGIVYPVGATERVVQTIGPSATKHLLYSAEIIDADRALRIGLIDELIDPSDFGHRVDELVDLLAHQRSLLTQMASKEIVTAALIGPVDPDKAAGWFAEMDVAMDSAEGIAAYREKRSPRFPWTPDLAGPAGAV
jgi:enoyl-CoA hydratase/carnithine racemase